MMKGSIELARLICVEIAGEPVPNDTDGDSYGSIEIAEILSAGYEKLKAENEALKAIYVANLLIEAVEKLSELVDQPDPEYLEKEAQRIDKPIEEQSTPGIIILNK